MRTFIRRPADQGDGKLASLRTLSSQAEFRVLLYTIEGKGGTFNGTNQWQSRAVSGHWLTAAHFFGGRGLPGCSANG